MGRGRKAVLTIKIPPLARRDLERFLERLQSSVIGETVIGEMRGDTIKIQIYGSRSTIQRSIARIKQLLREYSTPRAGPGRRYSVRLLSREAGVALPPDVLVEVLRLQGYRASYAEGQIETDAGEDEVVAAARLLGEAVRRLQAVHATRTAKKVLMAVLALDPSARPGEVAAEALSLGVFEELEDGRLHVPGDWREALKKLAMNRPWTG